MTPPPDDAWLAELLRDERHVDDGGFADRVTGALPPRRARRRFGAREAAILGGALCSGAVGVFAASGGALATLMPHDVGSVAAAVVVVALALWGAAAADA